MKAHNHLTISQIGLYNPQRLSDEAVENLFVVRTKIFDFLIEKISKENENSIPQHYLLIAQRGMGKTTMLKRLEVVLRKEPYKARFVPLLFPEEQYNLKNIAEFWLNCLDALADTLEVEQQNEIVKAIDKKVAELETIKNDEDLSSEAYKYLNLVCSEIKRRPVLLIDNMSLIFDRVGKAEQHQLRALLMQNSAPILVGASAVAIEDTYDYGAPFYDAFQIYYLKKLEFSELLDILINLAKLTNSEEVLPSIQQEKARLRTLHQLTGGNPRTAVMLFKLIVKGFSKEINDDLEGLLDEVTPLYKARFEELPAQLQVIVDAIALNWDPINLELLRKETRYENNQLSPQLKRLHELGWIEKLEAYQSKGSAYQISERFFNIWFLMRRSSRRQKRELYCLSKFLETFYGENLENVAEKRLTIPCKTLDHITYNLAMAEVVKDKNLRNSLQNLGYAALREQGKNDPELLKNFTIPEDRNAALEEEERLLALLKADEKNKYTWFSLAFLYQEILGEYKKAERAYLKVIEIDKNDANPWNGLGTLYQDYLGKYQEAETAYLKAIEIDKNFAYPKYNLVFLYRDKLNQFEKAKTFFGTLEIVEEIEDSYWLNQAIFDLYAKNEGIAEENLQKALTKIEKQLPPNTQDDWWRFGAVVSKIGYTTWFLTILEKQGFDVILAPYYVAVKAMTETNPMAYLNSKAVEIREPAQKLMEMMSNYISR